MLNVLGVAEKPGKHAREALTGVHLSVIDTPEGMKAVLEATDGKVAIRSTREVDDDHWSGPFDVVLTRESVDAALRLQCKEDPDLELPTLIKIEGPEDTKEKKVTFSSPINSDTLISHTKEVKFPDLEEIALQYRPGEVMIGLGVDNLKRLVNTLSKLGMEAVVLGVLPNRPKAPIYLQAIDEAEGVTALGVIMPRELRGRDQEDLRWKNSGLSRSEAATDLEDAPLPITISPEQMDIADEASKVEAGLREPEESGSEDPQQPEVSGGGSDVFVDSEGNPLKGLERAAQQGRVAFVDGAQLDANPYEAKGYKRAWERGWKDSAASREDGYLARCQGEAITKNPWQSCGFTTPLHRAWEMGWNETPEQEEEES
jgi:ribosome modulation factor